MTEVVRGWVPSDSDLETLGRRNTGWCTLKPRDRGRAPATACLSREELEIIRRVVAKAEEFDRIEEQRVGLLALQCERACSGDRGDGSTSCVACARKLEVDQKNNHVFCGDCGKVTCLSCKVDHKQHTGETIALCKPCFYQRELLMKSGAWFTNTLPKVKEVKTSFQAIQNQATCVRESTTLVSQSTNEGPPLEPLDAKPPPSLDNSHQRGSSRLMRVAVPVSAEEAANRTTAHTTDGGGDRGNKKTASEAEGGRGDHQGGTAGSPAIDDRLDTSTDKQDEGKDRVGQQEAPGMESYNWKRRRGKYVKKDKGRQQSADGTESLGTPVKPGSTSDGDSVSLVGQVESLAPLPSAPSAPLPSAPSAPLPSAPSAPLPSAPLPSAPSAPALYEMSSSLRVDAQSDLTLDGGPQIGRLHIGDPDSAEGRLVHLTRDRPRRVVKAPSKYRPALSGGYVNNPSDGEQEITFEEGSGKEPDPRELCKVMGEKQRYSSSEVAAVPQQLVQLAEVLSSAALDNALEGKRTNADQAGSGALSVASPPVDSPSGIQKPKMEEVTLELSLQLDAQPMSIEVEEVRPNVELFPQLDLQPNDISDSQTAEDSATFYDWKSKRGKYIKKRHSKKANAEKGSLCEHGSPEKGSLCEHGSPEKGSLCEHGSPEKGSLCEHGSPTKGASVPPLPEELMQQDTLAGDQIEVVSAPLLEATPTSATVTMLTLDQTGAGVVDTAGVIQDVGLIEKANKHVDHVELGDTQIPHQQPTGMLEKVFLDGGTSSCATNKEDKVAEIGEVASIEEEGAAVNVDNRDNGKEEMHLYESNVETEAKASKGHDNDLGASLKTCYAPLTVPCISTGEFPLNVQPSEPEEADVQRTQQLVQPLGATVKPHLHHAGEELGVVSTEPYNWARKRGKYVKKGKKNGPGEEKHHLPPLTGDVPLSLPQVSQTDTVSNGVVMAATAPTSVTEVIVLSVTEAVVPGVIAAPAPSVTEAVTVSSVTEAPAPSVTGAVVPSVIAAAAPSVTEAVVPSVIAATAPSVTEAVVPSVIASPLPSVTEAVVPSVIVAPAPSVTEAEVPSVIAAASPSVTEAVVPSVIATTAPSVTEAEVPSVIATTEPSVTEAEVPSVIATTAPSVTEAEVPSVIATTAPSVTEAVVPSVTSTIVLRVEVEGQLFVEASDGTKVNVPVEEYEKPPEQEKLCLFEASNTEHKELYTLQPTEVTQVVEPLTKEDVEGLDVLSQVAMHLDHRYTLAADVNSEASQDGQLSRHEEEATSSTEQIQQLTTSPETLSRHEGEVPSSAGPIQQLTTAPDTSNEGHYDWRRKRGKYVKKGQRRETTSEKATSLEHPSLPKRTTIPLLLQGDQVNGQNELVNISPIESSSIVSIAASDSMPVLVLASGGNDAPSVQLAPVNKHPGEIEHVDLQPLCQHSMSEDICTVDKTHTEASCVTDSTEITSKMIDKKAIGIVLDKTETVALAVKGETNFNENPLHPEIACTPEAKIIVDDKEGEISVVTFETPSEIQPLTLVSVPAQPLTMESVPAQPLTLESVPVQPLTLVSVPAQPLTLESVPAQPLTLESVPVQPLTLESVPAQPLTLESVPAQPLTLESVPAHHLVTGSTVDVDRHQTTEDPSLQPYVWKRKSGTHGKKDSTKMAVSKKVVSEEPVLLPRSSVLPPLTQMSLQPDTMVIDQKERTPSLLTESTSVASTEASAITPACQPLEPSLGGSNDLPIPAPNEKKEHPVVFSCVDIQTPYQHPRSILDENTFGQTLPGVPIPMMINTEQMVGVITAPNKEMTPAGLHPVKNDAPAEMKTTQSQQESAQDLKAQEVVMEMTQSQQESARDLKAHEVAMEMTQSQQESAWDLKAQEVVMEMTQSQQESARDLKAQEVVHLLESKTSASDAQLEEIVLGCTPSEVTITVAQIRPGAHPHKVEEALSTVEPTPHPLLVPPKGENADQHECQSEVGVVAGSDGPFDWKRKRGSHVKRSQKKKAVDETEKHCTPPQATSAASLPQEHELLRLEEESYVQQLAEVSLAVEAWVSGETSPVSTSLVGEHTKAYINPTVALEPTELLNVPPAEPLTAPPPQSLTIPPSESLTVPPFQSLTVAPFQPLPVPPSLIVPPSEPLTVPPPQSLTVPPPEPLTVPPSLIVPPSEPLTVPPPQSPTVPPLQSLTVPPSLTIPPSEPLTVPPPQPPTVPPLQSLTVPPSDQLHIQSLELEPEVVTSVELTLATPPADVAVGMYRSFDEIPVIGNGHMDHTNVDKQSQVNSCDSMAAETDAASVLAGISQWEQSSTDDRIHIVPAEGSTAVKGELQTTEAEHFKNLEELKKGETASERQSQFEEKNVPQALNPNEGASSHLQNGNITCLSGTALSEEMKTNTHIDSSLEQTRWDQNAEHTYMEVIGTSAQGHKQVDISGETSGEDRSCSVQETTPHHKKAILDNSIEGKLDSIASKKSDQETTMVDGASMDELRSDLEVRVVFDSTALLHVQKSAPVSNGLLESNSVDGPVPYWQESQVPDAISTEQVTTDYEMKEEDRAVALCQGQRLNDVLSGNKPAMEHSQMSTTERDNVKGKLSEKDEVTSSGRDTRQSVGGIAVEQLACSGGGNEKKITDLCGEVPLTNELSKLKGEIIEPAQHVVWPQTDTEDVCKGQTEDLDTTSQESFDWSRKRGTHVKKSRKKKMNEEGEAPHTIHPSPHDMSIPLNANSTPLLQDAFIKDQTSIQAAAITAVLSETAALSASEEKAVKETSHLQGGKNLQLVTLYPPEASPSAGIKGVSLEKVMIERGPSELSAGSLPSNPVRQVTSISETTQLSSVPKDTESIHEHPARGLETANKEPCGANYRGHRQEALEKGSFPSQLVSQHTASSSEGMINIVGVVPAEDGVHKHILCAGKQFEVNSSGSVVDASNALPNVLPSNIEGTIPTEGNAIFDAVKAKLQATESMEASKRGEQQSQFEEKGMSQSLNPGEGADSHVLGGNKLHLLEVHGDTVTIEADVGASGHKLVHLTYNRPKRSARAPSRDLLRSFGHHSNSTSDSTSAKMASTGKGFNEPHFLEPQPLNPHAESNDLNLAVATPTTTTSLVSELHHLFTLPKWRKVMSPIDSPSPIDDDDDEATERSYPNTSLLVTHQADASTTPPATSASTKPSPLLGIPPKLQGTTNAMPKVPTVSLVAELNNAFTLPKWKKVVCIDTTEPYHDDYARTWPRQRYKSSPKCEAITNRSVTPSETTDLEKASSERRSDVMTSSTGEPMLISFVPASPSGIFVSSEATSVSTAGERLTPELAAEEKGLKEPTCPEFNLHQGESLTLLSSESITILSAPQTVQPKVNSNIEGTATEGIATEGVATEDIATEGIATEGIATEGVATEDIATEGIATEDIATEGIATEDIDAPLNAHGDNRHQGEEKDITAYPPHYLALDIIGGTVADRTALHTTGVKEGSSGVLDTITSAVAETKPSERENLDLLDPAGVVQHAETESIEGHVVLLDGVRLQQEQSEVPAMLGVFSISFIPHTEQQMGTEKQLLLEDTPQTVVNTNSKGTMDQLEHKTVGYEAMMDSKDEKDAMIPDMGAEVSHTLESNMVPEPRLLEEETKSSKEYDVQIQLSLRGDIIVPRVSNEHSKGAIDPMRPSNGAIDPMRPSSGAINPMRPSNGAIDPPTEGVANGVRPQAITSGDEFGHRRPVEETRHVGNTEGVASGKVVSSADKNTDDAGGSQESLPTSDGQLELDLDASSDSQSGDPFSWRRGRVVRRKKTAPKGGSNEEEEDGLSPRPRPRSSGIERSVPSTRGGESTSRPLSAAFEKNASPSHQPTAQRHPRSTAVEENASPLHSPIHQPRPRSRALEKSPPPPTPSTEPQVPKVAPSTSASVKEPEPGSRGHGTAQASPSKSTEVKVETGFIRRKGAVRSAAKEHK